MKARLERSRTMFCRSPSRRRNTRLNFGRRRDIEFAGQPDANAAVAIGLLTQRERRMLNHDTHPRSAGCVREAEPRTRTPADPFWRREAILGDGSTRWDENCPWRRCQQSGWQLARNAFAEAAKAPLTVPALRDRAQCRQSTAGGTRVAPLPPASSLQVVGHRTVARYRPMLSRVSPRLMGTLDLSVELGAEQQRDVA